MKSSIAVLVLSAAFASALAQTAQVPVAPTEGMHHAEKPDAVPSTTLVVDGTATGSGQPVTLSLADLQAMPQTTVKVHNGHTKADETYSGPLLSEVLAKVGLRLTSKNEHDFLRMEIVARGTDDYFVLYSGAEVQPALHKAEVIVAIAQDGKSLTRTGAFQLIDSLDAKPARWVRNLNRLTVRTTLPEASSRP